MLSIVIESVSRILCMTTPMYNNNNQKINNNIGMHQ